MGSSTSKVSSEQSAQAYLTQQFSSSCDVSCSNAINNATFDFINSTLTGGLKLSQTCSANANCLSNNNMDATANVMLKAGNSSNAKNASNVFTGSIGNIDKSEINSASSIKEAINQSANETCNISSLNEMNNISVLAVNSDISGGIEIDQSGSATGSCQLNNTMTAAAYATGLAQNAAQSGKDKKGQKFGDKSGKARMWMYVILAAVVIIIVFIVAKVISGGSAKKKKDAEADAAFQAKAELGCPGGGKPAKDPTTGKYIRNPKSGNPICPPSDGSQTVNVVTSGASQPAAEGATDTSQVTIASDDGSLMGDGVTDGGVTYSGYEPGKTPVASSSASG